MHHVSAISIGLVFFIQCIMSAPFALASSSSSNASCQCHSHWPRLPTWVYWVYYLRNCCCISWGLSWTYACWQNFGKSANWQGRLFNPYQSIRGLYDTHHYHVGKKDYLLDTANTLILQAYKLMVKKNPSVQKFLLCMYGSFPGVQQDSPGLRYTLFFILDHHNPRPFHDGHHRNAFEGHRSC